MSKLSSTNHPNASSDRNKNVNVGVLARALLPRSFKEKTAVKTISIEHDTSVCS